MNGSNVRMNTVKGTSTLVRARFGPGMLLQHDDLEQLNTYTRELSRLLFRSFFGCGVVCGLGVKETRVCNKPGITVAKGLALGCEGDPVYVPKDVELSLAAECDEVRFPLFILLCPTKKCCSPRSSVCASDEDEPASVCTRERDGFEIRVVTTTPQCVCGCLKDRKPFRQDDPCLCANPEDPCYEDHYAGKCGCESGAECDCDCDCILLAKLTGTDAAGKLVIDHNVRRFIRPVLMSDPLTRKRVDPATDDTLDPVEELPDPIPAPAPPAPAPAPPPAGPEESPATPVLSEALSTTAVTKPARKTTKSMKLPEGVSTEPTK